MIKKANEEKKIGSTHIYDLTITLTGKKTEEEQIINIQVHTKNKKIKKINSRNILIIMLLFPFVIA